MIFYILGTHVFKNPIHTIFCYKYVRISNDLDVLISVDGEGRALGGFWGNDPLKVSTYHRETVQT